LGDEAVATSGIVRRKWEAGGKRFHHIVNPFSPKAFSFALQSVSVVSESVEEGDVWAKTLFVMGLEKGLEYADSRSLKAFFVDADTRVHCSAAARRLLHG
jgi:thiamine biosynthesis lipoprotein